MSRLRVELEGPDINRAMSGWADQFWRNKYASSLRQIADCVQTGRLEGEIDAGELQGSYRFETNDEPAAAADAA